MKVNIMGLGGRVERSEDYVKKLLKERLPDDMFFHNIKHTELVVKAVREIGLACNLNKTESEIVIVAGWFHDSGYCYTYEGHEEKSKAIATAFLKQLNADEDFILHVTSCIGATQMPQKPNDLLQQIICDADMFHLSLDQYVSYAENLRKEWHAKTGRSYSEREWILSNVTMLKKHRYFTHYGQNVLQKNKQKNIDRMLTSL
ncbi:HD domain-containing protein [Mucilaginibacter aquariorum]|uniref:HD domain-containing protein n=1 Tax=Mucilaginibacter aquariorum TaxID=2967225 RepID=A0ABT1T424_9SPHI|nr:HD domain-containing protein [Mucilaginibacter aquariorum]MCQ6959272.1 HD domain-containing protein [Mucilaginibacter aquariorum]